LKICTNSRIMALKLIREYPGRGWTVSSLNKL